MSSEVFSKVNHEIIQTLMRWAYKRHARKGKRWIVNKYFTSLRGDNWRFHCIVKDKNGKKKPLYLKNASDTKIRRHVKIKSAATPFNPLYKDYFKQREETAKRRKTISIKSAATPFNPLYKDYFKQREETAKRRKTISNYSDTAGLRIIQPY